MLHYLRFWAKVGERIQTSSQPFSQGEGQEVCYPMKKHFMHPKKFVKTKSLSGKRSFLKEGGLCPICAAEPLFPTLTCFIMQTLS
jgi:hypothetical protein